MDELVSEWELNEIRMELEQGDAPDIVAFRHGLPMDAVRKMKARNRRAKEGRSAWSESEVAFVADNYKNHGDKTWEGWKMLKRTWDAIRSKAWSIGASRKTQQLGEQ